MTDSTEAELQDYGRDGINSRFYNRVREIAVTAIVNATAKDRLDRADRSKARPTAELRDLQPGDQVDIWYDKSHKDAEGWRGPAKVVTVHLDENTVTVRYQGRSLDRRLGEVRRYVSYLRFLTSQKVKPHPQWTLLKEECENLALKSVRTVGLVWNASQRANEQGWYITKESRSRHGRRILAAALLVACTVAHMTACTTIRMCRGVTTLPPIIGLTTSEIWIWHSTLQGGDDDDPPRVFEPQDGDMLKPVEVNNLITDELSVRQGQTLWHDYSVLQFLGVRDDEAENLIHKLPGIRLLAGAGVSSGELAEVPNVVMQPPPSFTPEPTQTRSTPRSRFSGKRSTPGHVDMDRDSSPSWPPPAPPQPPPAVSPTVRSRTPSSSQSQMHQTPPGDLPPPPPPPSKRRNSRESFATDAATQERQPDAIGCAVSAAPSTGPAGRKVDDDTVAPSSRIMGGDRTDGCGPVATPTATAARDATRASVTVSLCNAVVPESVVSTASGAHARTFTPGRHPETCCCSAARYTTITDTRTTRRNCQEDGGSPNSYRSPDVFERFVSTQVDQRAAPAKTDAPVRECTTREASTRK